MLPPAKKHKAPPTSRRPWTVTAGSSVKIETAGEWGMRPRRATGGNCPTSPLICRSALPLICLPRGQESSLQMKSGVTAVPEIAQSLVAKNSFSFFPHFSSILQPSSSRSQIHRSPALITFSSPADGPALVTHSATIHWVQISSMWLAGFLPGVAHMQLDLSLREGSPRRPLSVQLQFGQGCLPSPLGGRRLLFRR